MPVSKNTRRKQAPKQPKTTATETALPDRRTMESFLAALTGEDRDDSLAQAQDVMYEAFERTTSRARVALARKALGISPLCADAYNLLAEEAGTISETRDLYAKGVEAGEMALGAEGFEEYAGQFWGFLETRPYMRARAGLANTLLKLGDEEAAIGHYRAMLELNPDDNQGIRYTLAGCLLRRNDEAALKQLLDAYEDECSTHWLYTRALLAFRDGGAEDEQAVSLAREAWEENSHVPAILSGKKPPARMDHGYLTVGGADEATWYCVDCGPAWHGTPGAVAWLAGITGAKPRKPRGGKDAQ